MDNDLHKLRITCVQNVQRNIKYYFEAYYGIRTFAVMDNYFRRLITIILLMTTYFSFSQTLLNGSFENTSASMSCNYNLSNAAFNSLMSDVNAFGGGNECDILINGCYTSGIPDGVRAIGVAHDPQDEIAMTLSAPLVTGVSYTLSFWVYSEISFRPQGNVEIGVSTNNTSFGSLIYTATTIPSTWVNYVFSFTAPNNGTHITVRNVAGAIHWNHVDHFEFASPLPVELIEFTTTLNERNQVELHWETASEIENERFTVQRSEDMQHWDDVVSVSGAGNSTELVRYAELDLKPLIGVSYYRLRQTDFNGTYSYSKVNTVRVEAGNIKLTAFPNPTTDILTLNGAELSVDKIEILDLYGKDISSLVKVVEFNSSQVVYDFSELPSGIYIIQTDSELIKVVRK